MYASKARHQYTQMGLFVSFTPIKIKLYTIKVFMKSNFFCLTSLFEKEFEYANEQYTDQINLIGLIFLVYTYHNQTSCIESIHGK